MPDQRVHIVVAGEPVAKGRPRVSVRGGKPQSYTPAKTRNYENLVKMAAGNAMDGRQPFDVPLTMRVVVSVPIPTSWSGKRQRMAEEGLLHPAKRPDLDNFVKAALDGCNRIVFADDSQVVTMHAYKLYSRTPRLDIWVQPAA